LAEDVEDLQRQFDQLETIDTLDTVSPRVDELLVVMVQSIQSIFLKYEPDFKRIPHTPGIWSVVETESLLDRLRKISQYVKACEELLRAARRYAVFSSITIDFVNLQQSGRRLDTGCDIDEVIAASCNVETLSRVASRHGQSLSAIQQNIKEKLGGRSRLHAEIQLVLFYEQHDSLLRPRVICSSKKACYLCNLFIKIHGQYHLPSTHGRLYDTWRWPALPQITDGNSSEKAETTLEHLLPEFGNAIDRKIQDCLAYTGVVRQIVPLESTVDLHAVITPSNRSYISQNSSNIPDGSNNHDGSGVNDALSKTSTETSKKLTSFPQTPQPQTGPSGSPWSSTSSSFLFSDFKTSSGEKISAAEPEVESSSVPPALQGRPKDSITRPTTSKPLLLSFGQVTHILVARGSSARFRTPKIHLEFSCEDSRTICSPHFQADDDTILQVTWLSDDVSRIDRSRVVDLEAPVLRQRDFVCDNIFSRQGMVFYGKGHAILIRARMQKHLRD
jgi:hypothetical protein